MAVVANDVFQGHTIINTTKNLMLGKHARTLKGHSSKSDHDNLNVKSELYGTDIGNMILYSVKPESLKTT